MIPGKYNVEKIVYFVRHGQSIANVTPVFQSDESPLSEEGGKQARRIADRLFKIKFEALLASPATRTRETAEYISQLTKKPVEYFDVFVERGKPTSVSGKSHDDKEASKKFDEWETSLYTLGYRIEDGENYNDIVARADKAIALLSDRSEKILVVVTHGYFLRVILARVLLGDSLTPQNFKNFQEGSITDNTGVSAIKYVKRDLDARWKLWVYNDHAHLVD